MMFKDYTFVLRIKTIDSESEEGFDENGFSEDIIMSLNPLTLLAALGKVEFKKGEETDIMGSTLIAFIDEISKSFNIINLV